MHLSCAYRYKTLKVLASLYSLHSWVGISVMAMVRFYRATSSSFPFTIIFHFENNNNNNTFLQTEPFHVLRVLCFQCPFAYLFFSFLQFFGQFALGFLMFFFPAASALWRQAYLPLHGFMGTFLYVGLCGTVKIGVASTPTSVTLCRLSLLAGSIRRKTRGK